MTKKKKSKYLAVILFLLVFACFLSSCSVFSLPEEELPGTNEEKKNPDENETKNSVFTIAYFSGEKINPYSSENRSNRAIISLCYEGLISLDKERNPVSQIADYTLSEAADSVTFTVKDTAVFSDGSSVTTTDIAYSFEQAKASSVYSFRFEEYISGWKVGSSREITVTFKKKNVYNVNLFDFPIVKKTNHGVYPIGSGKYIISTSDGKLSLEKNSHYYGSENFKMNTIDLVEITDSQDLNYNFNYGGLHAAYADLSDGSQRYKGNVELVTFMTNSLVFAVVNKSKPYFSSNAVSSALSLSVDRKSISEKALDSLGDIVWQPFNLNWGELINKDIKKDIYSSADAHTIFTEHGLTLNGTKRYWNGKLLELTLICNNEDITRVRIANSVADSLRNMGFSVNVVLYNWNDYKKVIASGEYDIYIAETTVPDNFDIRYMFSDKVVNTQTAASSVFNAALDSFYSGESDASTLFSAFNSEMPFIPLFYNRGALAVNRIVSGNFNPTEYSIFNGIETWSMTEE